MKSWLRGMTAVAAGLVAGSAAQAQGQGQNEPSRHPLEPAGYVDPPLTMPSFSDIFPAQNPLSPPSMPTTRAAVQYEAEPDINGRPKVHREPDPCPRYPVLYRLVYGDAIFDRAYLTPSYSVWTMKNGNIPFPVATTGTTGANPGVLNQGDTSVVLGNSKLDYGNFTGLSLTGGAWFSGSEIGLETDYFTLSKRTLTGTATGAQFPILGRPFFDTNLGSENAAFINFPGAFGNGSVSYASSSQMWGVSLNSMFRLGADANRTFDLLVGGRYMRLQEDLYITSRSDADPVNGVTSFAGQTLLGPNTVAIVDGTKTIVQFFGGTVGGRLAYTFGQFTATGTAKVTLGDSQNTIVGLGSSILNPGPGQTTAKGGLLVVGLNNSTRELDRIAWMPEAGLNLGWTPIQWLTLSAGYDFMYLSRVVRPGDQFDRNVNPTLIPTSPTFGVPFGAFSNPGPKVSTQEMWFSTFNVGVTFRF